MTSPVRDGYVPPLAGLADQTTLVDVFGEPLAHGRRGTWSQTASGARVWSLDPRAEDVHLLDLARGLAFECRYGRQIRSRWMWYSVAEHSIIVSLFVDEPYRREALLHDAGEAYGFGDVPRPLKHDPSVRSMIDEVEDRWVAAIYERFGIVSTPESRAAIKRVDDLVLLDEIDTVLADPSMYITRHPDTPERLHANLACLQPPQAEYAFLTRFGELFPEHAAEVERLLVEG